MAVDVLITGASGVLGKQVVAQLRAAGYSVVGCDKQAGEHADAQWDITVQDAPEPDCSPAVVVHAAAQVGRYQHPLAEARPLFDVNVAGTLRVIQWCEARQVKRLILISGAIVYGAWMDKPKSETDPAQPWLAGAYAASKYGSEQVARLLTSCDVTILRLSSLYGAGYARGLIQRLVGQPRQENCVRLDPPFDDAFDLLHVADAARTILRAVESPPAGLWNVGSGTLTTIREVAARCAEIVGVPVLFSESNPTRPARILNWVDDQRARRELGHTNQITLEQGIMEIVQRLQG